LYGAHVEAPRRSSIAQLQFIRFFIHGLVQYERYAMPFTLVNASTRSPRAPPRLVVRLDLRMFSVGRKISTKTPVRLDLANYD
jgi:hypothetical protein